MINSNECRVNNRYIRELRNSRGLEYDHDFVLTEEWMGNLFGDHDISIALQDLHPIPITAKILENSRFDLQPQRQSIYINRRLKIWLGSGDGSMAFLKHEDNNESYFIREVAYLHQIQNLYFGMYNEELI